MDPETKPFGGEELKFPVSCHFRIVAENVPGVREQLQGVLHGLNISAMLQDGHYSAKGAYLTFHFDVEVPSQEFMNRIDAAIRKAPHVKMVL
jgi:putative lipoic acid-binding regulatory protein